MTDSEDTIRWIRKNRGSMTPTEFIHEFNLPYWEAINDDLIKSNVVKTPTVSETREMVFGEKPRYKLVRVKGYSRHYQVYLKEGGTRQKTINVKGYTRKVRVS